MKINPGFFLPKLGLLLCLILVFFYLSITDELWAQSRWLILKTHSLQWCLCAQTLAGLCSTPALASWELSISVGHQVCILALKCLMLPVQQSLPLSGANPFPKNNFQEEIKKELNYKTKPALCSLFFPLHFLLEARILKTDWKNVE